MNPDSLFSAGSAADVFPEGDAARQAVDSLRGYAYQALAAALAWLDIDEKGRLFLEVAEDYSVIAAEALRAVQVKDTEQSGSITLISENVRDAIASFVDLVERNPDIPVYLRYFTTSKIGTERAIADRPAGMGGLDYWRKVSAGAPASPLRAILEHDKFPKSVREFVKARDDAELRRDLIRKIRWDCGKPDFSTLRQELEERLVVVGRDKFKLPASEARGLADLLVYRVLKKSVVKTPQDRVLTRGELYDAIDAATRLSMRRSDVEAMAQFASGLAGSLGEALSPDSTISTKETDWLIDGNTLPTPRNMIPRVTVETASTDALGHYGAAILAGSSGLGKSSVARAAASASAGAFAMVHFRDADANETRLRLDMVFARIGGLPVSVLILEDLNQLDDARVALSLGRVIEALRRRDRTALITCYRAPAARALTDAGLDLGCVVSCPYFSEDEARELVRINGGDPDKWGRLAYLSGACGHPQLTHAFVIGMAAHGWPVEEIPHVVTRGLSSKDTDATRDAARRNLVSALPEGTRNILYRLSLTSGRFGRPLALTLGALPPPISQAGECIDELVGPWIEAVGNDLYRVSPLASNFGRETLTADEQRQIHEAIAVQMLSTRKIYANDANTILTHALAGKSPYSLVMLAHSVLTADSPTLEILAEHFTLLPLLLTDRLIVPDNPSVSAMLRLAQFKLAAAAGDGDKASDTAAALFNEITEMPEGKLRDLTEKMAILAVLFTMGVANYLENWINLLSHCRTMVEADDFLQGIRAKVEGSAGADGVNFYGALFGIGSSGLASVERLEHVIDELDKLDASERGLLLGPVEQEFSDYSILINGPWAKQARDESFKALDAAERYRRMAEKTQNWGIRPLTAQCWVARAVMLDEYENDKEGALAVLDDAVSALGDDPIITRARAKVYWRHDQHPMALEIMRGIADQIGVDSPIERAYALREAAISAAKCDEWPQAENWFLEAQSAAKLAQIDDMHVMAVGLGADAAVAELEAGDVGQALTRLADSVEALAGVEPDASLRAGHCHRVIRHTVLWMQSRIEGGDVKIDGKPIWLEAGTCSNPDPLPAILELPLGPIDTAWYMLAEAEIAAGLDIGIAVGLSDRLTQGPIPVMEFGLRRQKIIVDIDSLDADRFAANLESYIEGAMYILKERDRLRTTFDARAPERGQIPALSKNEPLDPLAEQTAIDAILAYGIRAALENRREAMTELETALSKRFAGDIPGQVVFDHWNGKPTSLAQLPRIVLYIIKAILMNGHIEPRGFFMASLRIFEHINQSNFKPLLTPHVAGWLRAGWKRITTTESFRLSRPRETIPAIEAVLRTPADDQHFVAELLLATSEAVGSRLDAAYRDSLRAMAEEAELL